MQIRKRALCFALSTVALLASVSAQADNQPIQGAGYAAYGSESMDALRFNGNLALDGTKIKNVLDVTGRLKAENAEIGELRANGDVKLRKTTVNGKSTVNGFLETWKSTFKGPLSVSARSIELVDSKVKSIEVRSFPGARLLTQVVELMDGTKVEGDVVFQSGNGQVVIDKSSKIEGQVKGGSIKQLDK